MGNMGKSNLHVAIFASIIIGLIIMTTNIEVASSEKDKAPPEKEIMTFIDTDLPTHYGSSCDDAVETDKFKFIKGGVKWNESNFPVKYRLASSAEPFREAITDSFNEWDDHSPLAVDFFLEDPTSSNVVSFSNLGGPGGTLAVVSLIFNSNKDMLLFRITFDSTEDWNVPGGFDVQNVATHEVGHVVGLDHRKSTKDCLLTMFNFAQPDETDKRSLAIGDIEGITKLYS